MTPAGRIHTAVGLMSGTSLDGIDAALIRTDGQDFVEPLRFTTLPYDPDLQLFLREDALGKRSDPTGKIARAERDLTLAHADVVRELLADADIAPQSVDIIGFHGQTLFHDPDAHVTWQIGDGALMAAELGLPVINDFRRADMEAGGEGAPLIPLYHRARALASGLPRPLAVLNIGGVANVTWIGEGQNPGILAFDTGPGVALMDDYMWRRTGKTFDANGGLAASGALHPDILASWLAHPYFTRKAPKSLDRNAWDTSSVRFLAEADAMATLNAFTAHAVRTAQHQFPAPVRGWLVTGGGRHNATLMDTLGRVLDAPVHPVESVGWNGDALEAEGFAYLAVRSLLGLPLSLPSTTGVLHPLTGGVLHPAPPRGETCARA
ncbi:MAG TPA: anhydro-N-acetylmuramic acid kinase [Alphaproteobacteria bacterium]|nr:anhydro-N-acetylmuramic acid kinase [Alphaproteobacteria bacterium]